MPLWKNKNNRAVVSFSSYTPKEFRNLQNRNIEGELSREAMSGKGQLFVLTNSISNGERERANESGIAENILKEVYYSYPSDDVVTCLKHAFHDANILVHELLNEKGKKREFGVKCSALVITNERGYIAQVGDNHIYRITSDKLERLTSDNILVGGKQSFALGLEAKINVHFNRYIALKAGDSYLLSTKGLNNINQHLVKRIVLSSNPHDAGKKVSQLVQKSGHKDKINIQVIRINATPMMPVSPKTGLSVRRAWVSALGLFLIVLTAIFVFLRRSDERPDQELVQIRAIQLDDAAGPEKEETPPEEIVSNSEQTNLEPAQLIVEDDENSDVTPNEPGNSVAAIPAEPEVDLPILDSPALGERWNLKNLTESDYEIKADKITFLATPNIKKALYQSGALSDFNVQMDARIRTNNAAGRFGVIVGYRTMKDSPYEVYYLLSLFRQQEFLLQKYSAFRKELVTRIPINFDSPAEGFQDIQLEVKCSGSFIELHANQKQIFRWHTGEKLVSGQVGVFVSPETEVQVSKFEVVKGAEFSRK